MREHLCFFSLFVLTELVIYPSAEPEEDHEGKILYFNVDVNNTVSVIYSRGSNLPYITGLKNNMPGNTRGFPIFTFGLPL